LWGKINHINELSESLPDQSFEIEKIDFLEIFIEGSSHNQAPSLFHKTKIPLSEFLDSAEPYSSQLYFSIENKPISIPIKIETQENKITLLIKTQNQTELDSCKITAILGTNKK